MQNHRTSANERRLRRLMRYPPYVRLLHYLAFISPWGVTRASLPPHVSLICLGGINSERVVGRPEAIAAANTHPLPPGQISQLLNPHSAKSAGHINATTLSYPL